MKINHNNLRGFYLQHMTIKKLSKSNEELFKQINNLKNVEEIKQIQDLLILSNLGLIRYLIRKRCNPIENFCSGFRITYDDLFSLGLFGVWKAIITYDIDKKVKFATYMSRIVINEIELFVRKNKRHNTVMSFEKPVNTDSDGNELVIADIIADKTDYTEQFIMQQFSNSFMETFHRRLSPREKIIVKLYFSGDFNQDEVSKYLNISQGHVSRIIKQIKLKGKNYLKILA